MKRTVSLTVEVEEGKHVLLVALCSTGQTLSVAIDAKPEMFGSLVQYVGMGEKLVTVTYGELKGEQHE